MDYSEHEDEQEMMKGIISMLLGLAALAELLCLLPLTLRVLLLPPLRYAVAVTRAFATEQAGGALALPLTTALDADGDGCDELLRLAACFRALASIIGFLSGLQDFSGRPPFRGNPNRPLAQRAPAMAWQHHSIKARRAMASCAAGRVDTS